jgi:16S rRNA G966 N2-methylase RsmD
LGFLEKVLPLCADLLAPNGVLYVESEQAFATLDATDTASWQILRQDKAGSVHFHLLQRNTDSGEAV